MNRLRLLIIRYVGPLAISDGHGEVADQAAVSSELIEDLKMFALVWLGGFVFFGTLIA